MVVRAGGPGSGAIAGAIASARGIIGALPVTSSRRRTA
jgi:hypothetical protein